MRNWHLAFRLRSAEGVWRPISAPRRHEMMANQAGGSSGKCAGGGGGQEAVGRPAGLVAGWRACQLAGSPQHNDTSIWPPPPPGELRAPSGRARRADTPTRQIGTHTREVRLGRALAEPRARKRIKTRPARGPPAISLRQFPAYCAFWRGRGRARPRATEAGRWAGARRLAPLLGWWRRKSAPSTSQEGRRPERAPGTRHRRPSSSPARLVLSNLHASSRRPFVMGPVGRRRPDNGRPARWHSIARNM